MNILTKRFMLLVFAASSFILMSVVMAQSELAATLEVLSPGVEVRRVNTSNWISVNVEGIVGVGDVIRTDGTGRARITFFADGTDTEILPNTEYRIHQFEGDEAAFNISVEVIIGQTLQRLNRLLDANSQYEVITPSMSLGARGTQFAVRVEDGGRSAMLVSDGTVAAENSTASSNSAEVPLGFGIRAEVEGVLSDVVRATTFAELDSALDGCQAVLMTPDDVSINVRVGAGVQYPRVGVISSNDIDQLYGVTEAGSWYRIQFRDGFGWIMSSSAEVEEGCVALRGFPNNYGVEDATLYSSIGDVIALQDLAVDPIEEPVEATPEATVEAP